MGCTRGFHERPQNTAGAFCICSMPQWHHWNSLMTNTESYNAVMEYLSRTLSDDNQPPELPKSEELGSYETPCRIKLLQLPPKNSFISGRSQSIRCVLQGVAPVPNVLELHLSSKVEDPANSSGN
ncbi:hypothetical protein Tco_0139108 [Tanacetum coccineum]